VNRADPSGLICEFAWDIYTNSVTHAYLGSGNHHYVGDCWQTGGWPGFRSGFGGQWGGIPRGGDEQRAPNRGSHGSSAGSGGGPFETLRAFISRPACQNALMAATWSVAGDATLVVAGYRSAVRIGSAMFTYRRAIGKAIGILPEAAKVGRGGMRRGLFEVRRGVHGAAGTIVAGLHESVGANWAAQAIAMQLPTDSLWELVPIVGSAIALRDAYNICGGP